MSQQRTLFDGVRRHEIDAAWKTRRPLWPTWLGRGRPGGRPGRDPCPWCGRRDWWRSRHGVFVCRACHPPVAPELVEESRHGAIGRDPATHAGGPEARRRRSTIRSKESTGWLPRLSNVGTLAGDES
jgi:hypothetical protein